MANFGDGIGDALGCVFSGVGCLGAVVLVLAGAVVYLLVTR